MQSVRFLVRQIGIPDKALDIYSAQETSEYIEYQYTSQGYVVESTHYLGEVKDGKGTTLGYKVMLVLTRNESVAAINDAASVPVTETTVQETAVRRGRPAKVS